MGEKWWNTLAPTNYTMSQSTHRPADSQSDVSSNSKNSTRTSPWRRADVDGFGLKHTAGPRSVCVCDGGWGLHLLPLSCCQAGVQPTAPGPKPSRRQARTTGERGGGKQKESIKIERWEGRIRSGNQKTRAGEESGEEEDDGKPGEKAAKKEEGTKQSLKDGQSQVITLSGERERDVGKQEEIRRLTERMEHVTGCSRLAWKANGQK